MSTSVGCVVEETTTGEVSVGVGGGVESDSV